MIEYKVGHDGKEKPVLKPLAIVLLYLICGLYAVFCGFFGKISVLALLFLPLAVSAAVLGFLLCRPRVWHYLLLPFCAGISFLCGGGFLGAVLTLDFFLIALVTVLCLQRNLSYTATVGIALLVILAVSVLGLLALVWEEGYSFSFTGAWDWWQDITGDFRLTLQKLIRVTASGVGIEELLGAEKMSVGELVTLVTSYYDSALLLVPGLCGALLLVLSYGCVALSFRALTVVPAFRAALVNKRIAFARPWGFFFLALWVLRIFLTTGNAFGIAMLNLYLCLLPGLAYVGFVGLWHSRRGPYGKIRVFPLVLLILCAVSLAMPSYLFSYTLPFLAFYGAVLTAVGNRH